MTEGRCADRSGLYSLLYVVVTFFLVMMVFQWISWCAVELWNCQHLLVIDIHLPQTLQNITIVFATRINEAANNSNFRLWAMDVTVRSVSESQSGLSDSWQVKKDGQSVLLSTIYKKFKLELRQNLQCTLYLCRHWSPPACTSSWCSVAVTRKTQWH